jgi:predicted MFS family arabinose efflux permease
MALFAPFFCLGLAVSTPATQSLISKTTSRDMQGGIFGLTQGLGALARICGPLIGQTTYKLWYALPYIVGGGLIFIALLVAWAWIPEPKREGVPPTVVPAE